MKTVLVTGAGGLLGRKILKAARGTFNIVASDVYEIPGLDEPKEIMLDITDKKQVSHTIELLEPDCVINTAAITDVDLCEKNQELAWQVNVEGTANLAWICAKRGIRLIHLSSDYVFDGEDGPYSERDQTKPIVYYGLTKLESEKAVFGRLLKAVVIRTAVLYGWEENVRPNFVRWVFEKLSKGEIIKVVTDQWNTPTLADDLALFLLKVVDSDIGGLCHYTGGDLWIKYDMAKAIAEEFGLQSELINPVTSEQLGQLAKRPLRSGLKTDKVQELFGVKPVRFLEGLSIFADQARSTEKEGKK